MKEEEFSSDVVEETPIDIAEGEKTEAEAETCDEPCESEQETVEEKEEGEEKEEREEKKEEKSSRGEKKKLKKAEAELSELKKTLDQKDAAFADLNDKYLRLCAEYDNFRKRSSKEKEGIYADACCDILEQILPVLDNLERAALYNTEDAAETPMGKGLELTLRSFMDTLQKIGVTEIEAFGKPFNPDLHNAVMHVDDENYGENEIVEVFMKGYAKGDKVLRYSMVKVAN
ncbi:MAG: nucleotide exchange factor GrpE [Clostridia bacterium]|nr:nucleotide exchange factor GrpE [Clostridia bacterium]